MFELQDFCFYYYYDFNVFESLFIMIYLESLFNVDIMDLEIIDNFYYNMTFYLK